MVAHRGFETPDLVTATLHGIATARDHADLLAWVRKWIQQAGSVRVLIRLEAFAGWKADKSLAQSRFWLDDHEGVVKLAIVGALAWRQSVLTYVAHPLRQLPIRYFETETEARNWLETTAQTSATALV
jgi:hypothetical protein